MPVRLLRKITDDVVTRLTASRQSFAGNKPRQRLIINQLTVAVPMERNWNRLVINQLAIVLAGE